MIAEQRRTIWAVLGLMVAGAGAITLRSLTTRQAGPSSGESLWRLRYEIRFRSAKPGGRIRVALPDNTASCRIYRESFSRAGLAMDVVRSGRTQGRSVVVLVPGKPGEGRFAAEFEIRVDLAARAKPPLKEPLSEADRRHYLRAEGQVQTDSPIVRKALASVGKGEPRPLRLLQAIYVHCCTGLERGDVAGPPDAEGVLKTGLATALGRVRAMIALCRVGGIPARAVTGFVLGSHASGRPVVWLEAHDGARWVPHDPERGYVGDLPPSYLPVRRDGVEIVYKSGATDVSASLLAQPIVPEPAAPRGTAARVVDLSRLPLGMQHTLALLLLLPAGALITAVFRNVVGLQTFGTFTPALLALSFLYSDFWTGLVVFVLVVTAGLGMRGLLERLKLLMVPRLSILLTVVVLCLAMAVCVLDFAGLTPSARAVILPMVILTMMIERFYITREEDGLSNALKLLGGTFVVAACCLALLGWEALGRLVLRFPECELFVAAGLLLIGRYSGYRLSELLRFRDLARGPLSGG